MLSKQIKAWNDDLLTMIDNIYNDGSGMKRLLEKDLEKNKF